MPAGAKGFLDAIFPGGSASTKEKALHAGENKTASHGDKNTIISLSPRKGLPHDLQIKGSPF